MGFILLQSPLFFAMWAVAFVSALTFHEFSHAIVGKWRGDLTAERYGRLTLNPLAHLDVWGTLSLLFLGFGWAKPVPYNPRELRHPQDSVLIALAGPGSNLVLAALTALVFRALGAPEVGTMGLLPTFLALFTFVNLALACFNVLPLPPLDGSKVLMAALARAGRPDLAHTLEERGPQLLMFLVLLSIVTPISVFGFIAPAAQNICDALFGVSCMSLF